MTSIDQPSAKRKRVAQFAICDGRERLGSVEQTEDAFVAFDSSGNPSTPLGAALDRILAEEAVA
jgi:hypothetical protein